MPGRRTQRRSRRASHASSVPKNVDSRIIYAIKKHLRAAWHIRNNRILTGYAIKIKGGRCKVLGRRSRFKLAFTRGLIHTPDILVVDCNNKPALVIEQDGRVHDSAEHVEKDGKRNRHYAEAGIPYIVLNSKKIRSLKLSLLEYLDKEMSKVMNGDVAAGLQDGKGIQNP